MTKEPSMPLPIERIDDVLAHWTHADDGGTPEFGAWIHALVLRDRVVEAIGRADQLRPGDTDQIAFWTDIELITQEAAEQQRPVYVKRDRQLGAYREETLGEVVASVAGAEILPSYMSGERNFSDEELIGIVEAHFAAEEAFLTSGDARKSYWTESIVGQERVGSWEQANDLEVLTIVARHLDKGLEEPQYAKRINAVTKRLGILYATHGYMGRAIGLLSSMDDVEEIQPLLDVIVDRMESDRAEYGEEYYQSNFHYAGVMLRGRDTLAAFRERLLPAPVPRIEDANSRVMTVGNAEMRIEEWVDDEPIQAHTSNGETIELPFLSFRQRATLGLGTELEHAMHEPQYNVDFKALDADLRKRVFRRVVEVNNPSMYVSVDTDREPLEKLVLGFGYTLMSFDVSEGEWKLLPTLDPNHIDEDKAGRNSVIRSAEEVGEVDWLITRYSGWYMYMEGFDHNDILRVAPEGANAFWIAGNPRIVDMPERLVADIGKTKVVLTPVKFYRTEKAV